MSLCELRKGMADKRRQKRELPKRPKMLDFTGAGAFSAISGVRYVRHQSETLSNVTRKYTEMHMDVIRKASEPAMVGVENFSRIAFEGPQRYIDNLSRNQVRAIENVTKSMLQTQRAIAGGAAQRAIRASGGVTPKLTESLGLGGLAAKQAQAVAARAVRDVRRNAEREVEGPAPSPKEVRELLSSRPTSA